MEARGHKFPREHRLRKSRDFSRCHALGSRLYSKYFRLDAAFSPGEPARLGLAVSRKVGNAVIRNRVKRLVRELFRQNAANVAGWQVVVVARPGAGANSYAEVAGELLPLLSRLKPSCPDSSE